MHACTGERIMINSAAVGRPRRSGEVLEVLGDGPSPPYRVRWSDGAVSILCPGADAYVAGPELPRS